MAVSENRIGEGNVRGIHLEDMDIKKFFMFFKRLDIALVRGDFKKIRGMELPVGCDFTGTVAADKSDPGHRNSLHDFMVTRKLVTEREYIVAIEFSIGERLSPNSPIEAYVSVTVSEHGVEKEKVRKIRLDMDIKEFFMSFKRFDIALVHGNFEKIRGRDLPVEFDDS